jgi:hypothetical protein
MSENKKNPKYQISFHCIALFSSYGVFGFIADKNASIKNLNIATLCQLYQYHHFLKYYERIMLSMT